MQKAMAPDRPFFVYYATGTTHAPHHAPKEWIEKFKGKFDQGWDQVREETLRAPEEARRRPARTRSSRRAPTEIPAWDSLTPTRSGSTPG